MMWRLPYFLPRMLLSTLLCVGLLATCVFALPGQAIASPRLARLLSVRTEHDSSDRIEVASLTKASVLRLRLVLPGSGITSIQVRRLGYMSGGGPLMQGYSLAPDRGERRSARFGKRWAAASLADGKRLTLNFAIPGPHGAAIFFALTARDNARAFRIVRAPHFALANKGCLSSHATSEWRGRETMVLTSKPNLGKELSISTVADHLWSDFYGSEANSRIQTIANSASAIYGSDLGMRISLVDQKVETSPSAYPSSITSSEQFLNRVKSQELLKGANEMVGFTARSFDNGIVGLAYVGTVCRDPSSAYSVVRRFQDALDPIIFAHEIGHGLSALHDVSGIMSSSLSAAKPPSSFSGTSASQIVSHVQTYGSCLTSVMINPTSTATPVVSLSATPSSTKTPMPPAPTATPGSTPTQAVLPTATATSRATPTVSPTATLRRSPTTRPSSTPTRVARTPTTTPTRTPTATASNNNGEPPVNGSLRVDLTQVGEVKRQVARLKIDVYSSNQDGTRLPIKAARVSVTCLQRSTKVTQRGVTGSSGVVSLRLMRVAKGNTCQAQGTVSRTSEQSARIILR